jgi:hypothetical protein
MSSLAQEISALLAAEGIPHALIGAAAMAAHGVSRSTEDLDLLVVDERLLDPAYWREGLPAGTEVLARRGDASTALAGLVSVTAPGERRVDIVVGRDDWQREMLARASKKMLGAGGIPVVGVGDLVLLKLFAGGLQDAWDIQLLLAGPNAAAIRREIPLRIEALPARCHQLWTDIEARRLPQG